MEKVDLNAPAFGDGAQKVVPAVAAEALPAEEVKPVIPEQKVEADAETQVPYSRFKKFHDAAKEAEREAEYWRAKALEPRSEPERPAPVADDVPPQWVKLYGDSAESKEAWAVQKALNADMLEQARREAREAIYAERTEEAARTDANMELLDEQFEDLQDVVGRTLTDAEQSALLDIVDEFTPKDRQGNYTGDTLPIDKAWEIYELKNNDAKAPIRKQRDGVAGITGSQTQGETTVTTEKDKNFNPFDWDAYKRRI